MTREPILQEELQEIAPELFRDELDNQTCLIEVGEGWNNILSTLTALIKRRVDSEIERDQGAFDVDLLYFSQIKEKNGALRVYLSMADPILDAYILFAEELSRKTCEITGEQGWLHKSKAGGILKTLSPEMAEHLDFDPVETD